MLRHDVDLAIGRAEALGQDAVALGHQKGGGAAFRREAGAERRDPRRRGELCGASGGVAPSVFAIVASDLFGELERAGIDLAARPARQFDRMRHRVLDAVALQR